ncbi:sec-independent translocase [Actinacidiphila bryophytorum]|uniref:Sec-independent protein translocase protein TatB n=1 Tax=Actinacidiphila bryophytorum TaxID=1436133 RepID=A0A9W4E2G8_9ACTN|nr:sec-independent translocase [Actinacidiphila bryophytorum]MBM9440726.1 Sec-independent protein translocase subunit TatB [Actinacidiphila bryophytorum]MBN6547236.1 Sec-independent protein translocase subunit TatB [Actinacidiphila bryophytorum]CAG7604059.1 Sec-independent protein translocase protein TatB [Actinacidiphila bryophytorum]
MFFDIGPLELVALVVLAVLVFGPDKLPKVIQDTMAFIRKVREFSDSAKEDIRRELGPEFKDFEFEDLNPKTFIRKNLMNDEDEYGLKELRDLGSSLDLRKEMAEVTDAVNGVETPASGVRKAGTATAAASGTPGPTTPDRLRKREQLDEDEPPPFDADAT